MQSRQPLTTSRKSPGSDRDTGKVGLTTGVKLRGPEGAQRLRATSASTSELAIAILGSHHHRCTYALPHSLSDPTFGRTEPNSCRDRETLSRSLHRIPQHLARAVSMLRLRHGDASTLGETEETP
jgi:hypothetical protein